MFHFFPFFIIHHEKSDFRSHKILINRNHCSLNIFYKRIVGLGNLRSVSPILGRQRQGCRDDRMVHCMTATVLKPRPSDFDLVFFSWHLTASPPEIELRGSHRPHRVTMPPLLSQSVFPNTSNLGDDILSEFRVPDHSMGQTRRKEGDVSLYLMHHSLCVGQPHLVLHAGDLVASNHAVDFFMNFGCRDMNHECYARDIPWTPGNYLKCLQYATESGLEKAPNQNQRYIAK